ncbi:hypothetical protein V3C99_017191 [Haemonchus contortus]|uniref:Uncharacterized protein n=1 Tax=Haemonchus contortus TaxID=6289 RepID=A0A7I4Z549_HAECO
MEAKRQLRIHSFGSTPLSFAPSGRARSFCASLRSCKPPIEGAVVYQGYVQSRVKIIWRCVCHYQQIRFEHVYLQKVKFLGKAEAGCGLENKVVGRAEIEREVMEAEQQLR